MEQNNSIPNNTGSEYTFPQNKEQFRQVLRQAQEGQYRQPEQDQVKPVREKFTPREESRAISRPQRTEPQRAVEEPRQPEKFDYRQPAFSTHLTPVKKKFNPLVIILPLIILIIAAAAVFFFFLNNTVSYRKAEENYFGGLMKNSLEAKKFLSENEQSSCRADIKVSIPELINTSIPEMTLGVDAVRRGEALYTILDAVVINKSFTAEGWADLESTAVLFPEISDIYLCLNTPDYTEIFGDITAKTANAYFELTGEPEAEKNVEFTANGMSFIGDRYVIHLDGVQLAALERAVIVNTLANDDAAAVICKEMGYETKAELMEDKRVKAVFDELEQIITGEKSNTDYLDMTVYVKNKTVIGREITFTDAVKETDTEISSVNMSDTDIAPEENYNKRIFLDIYDIPTEKGTFNHIYYKVLEKDKTFSDEIYISREDETKGKGNDIHSGKITAGFNGNTVTLDYTELAVTEELFQGKINVVSANNPALAMNAELKTDGDNRLLNLSIPNLVNIDVTFSSSEIEFKEMPELSEGEYAELSEYNGDESEAMKKFKSDLAEYIDKLINYDYSGDKVTDGSENNTENNTTFTPEKDTNETGILVDPTDTDTTAVSENPPDNTSDSVETADNNADVQEEVTAAGSEAVSETAPITTSVTAAVTVPNAVYHAPSTLDTGDAQRISSAGLDRFNSGNYYTAEIYVDGGANANGNVTVSELGGEFDAYIKGKVLQIDFAEGYDFDSALVVITFPYGTVSGGRNYPYSDTLKGLDRYLVLGSEDGNGYGDSEIECYKYSDNQLGFIVEGSGYYYVVDLDSFFHDVMGGSPENLDIY